MRFFLRAHRPGLTLAGVIEPCFLHDLAAAFEQFDLTPCLEFNRLPDEADRVDVLGLGPGAQLGRADRPHGDVNVCPHRTLLHIPVAGSKVAQDRAQLGHIGRGFIAAAKVGLGDDLHQRNAGPVQVDERAVRVLVVDRLARVLLKVDPFDADGAALAVLKVDGQLPLAHDRVIELRNLIALRQVGVEVVLAVEDAVEVDLGLDAKTRAHGLSHAFLIQHGQHARQRGIDQRNVVVGRLAESGRGPGEQLGFRQHLRMDFHADDNFPLAGLALDGLCHVFSLPRPSAVGWR